jgi:hypothetical protein
MQIPGRTTPIAVRHPDVERGVAGLDVSGDRGTVEAMHSGMRGASNARRQRLARQSLRLWICTGFFLETLPAGRKSGGSARHARIERTKT